QFEAVAPLIDDNDIRRFTVEHHSLTNVDIARLGGGDVLQQLSAEIVDKQRTGAFIRGDDRAFSRIVRRNPETEIVLVLRCCGIQLPPGDNLVLRLSVGAQSRPADSDADERNTAEAPPTRGEREATNFPPEKSRHEMFPQPARDSRKPRRSRL